MCEEFSRCYNDVSICLWTNGSRLGWSMAEAACRQRNNSFLARISDSRIQNKLAVFRNDAGNLLSSSGFWIGVHAVSFNDFHWLDGSPLAGLLFCLHDVSGIFYCRLYNLYFLLPMRKSLQPSESTNEVYLSYKIEPRQGINVNNYK